MTQKEGPDKMTIKEQTSMVRGKLEEYSFLEGKICKDFKKEKGLKWGETARSKANWEWRVT